MAQDLISQSLSAYQSGDSNYIDEISQTGQKVYDQMMEISVPENMLDIHIKGLQLAQYALSLKDEVKPSSDDPLSNIVSLSKVQSLLTLVENYGQDVQTRLEDLNISEIPFTHL